jgi:hypothetical protein
MAGPEGSGGADDYTPVSAWFKTYDTSKSVKACFEVAPDFGVKDWELAEMVRSPFNLWGSYLEEKKLLEQIPAHALKIATSLELNSNCQGNEDLKFYFGTEDEKVKQAKAQYERPFGFAELNHRHERFQEDWSSGFIWIANSNSLFPQEGIPSWNSSANSLRALILHELGHVFGNGHVTGTVMTPDLAKYLINDTRPRPRTSFLSAYDSIDSLIELVPCIDCKVSYSSKLDREYLSEAYRLLTNKEPVGHLFATFKREGLGFSEIVLKDDTGEHHFPVVLSGLIGGQTDSAPLFLGLGGMYFASEGRSYQGEIQTPEGNKILVAVNYNMNQQKISVKTIGVGKKSNILFVTE